MPGLPIKVTLKYAQTVTRLDGGYELVIPLVAVSYTHLDVYKRQACCCWRLTR